jgi:ankyrin repeat protein
MDEHNAQSDSDTALHDASRHGHVEVVKALLAAGADPKAVAVRAHVVGW